MIVTYTTTELATVFTPLAPYDPTIVENYIIRGPGETVEYEDNYFTIQEFTNYPDVKTYMDSQVSGYDIADFLDGPAVFDTLPEVLTFVSEDVGTAVTLDATSTVTAPLVVTYQWYKYSENELLEISGATSATLATASLTEEQAGGYVCIVTVSDPVSLDYDTERVVFDVTAISPNTLSNTNSFGIP